MSGVPIIGLTGGIASGKSAVADILEEQGCFVSDSDMIAHEVLEEKDVSTALVDRWGTEVLSDDGSIKRSEIARRIFTDAEERTWLEGILHPRIHQRRRSAINSVIESGRVPACVIDAPLLFEAGIEDECTTIVFVDTPRERRLEWAVQQRGWSQEDFDRRERAQLDVEEKKRRSDRLILNDGTREQLRTRTCEAFHSIISDSHAGGA